MWSWFFLSSAAFHDCFSAICVFYFSNFFAVLPFITVPPQAAAVEESGSVEFTCFAVGTPTPSIRWEFQGDTVGTGNTLTIGMVCVCVCVWCYMCVSVCVCVN